MVVLLWEKESRPPTDEDVERWIRVGGGYQRSGDRSAVARTVDYYFDQRDAVFHMLQSMPSHDQWFSAILPKIEPLTTQPERKFGEGHNYLNPPD